MMVSQIPSSQLADSSTPRVRIAEAMSKISGAPAPQFPAGGAHA